MSDTKPPAWAVGRARELRIELESTQRYGPIDSVDPHDGSVQRRVEQILASALTVPDGHVRLPSGDQSLPWKVIHVASNEVVASFKWGDVAQTYIKRGIEIGGWHEHELRLQQAAESARAGGGA